MADWGFLTNHARVLLHIARDPGARLRDIGASLGITERRAHGIITDLAEAGYVITQKDGRRNRYQIQAHLPVPRARHREPAIGEVVALFTARHRTGTGPAPASNRDARRRARRRLPDLAAQQHPDIAGEKTQPDPAKR